MKQKITFLFLLLTCSSALIFGQMVNDFESGASGLLNVGGGITAGIVANPNPTGLNTTANCLEIKRTGAQWWILQGIDVNDLAISGTKYLSVMVHFSAQSDLGFRFDAPNDTSNGTGIVRGLNTYTNFNQWQEIVFEIQKDGGTTPATLVPLDGTLFRLTFHPDMGFENDPSGQVLDAAGTISGYIDQIQILDENPLPPLSTASFKLEQSISLYPNPAESSFRLDINDDISVANISIYNVLGKKIKSVTKMKDNEYNISNLSTGLYMVKIIDNKGVVATKKLYKK